MSVVAPTITTLDISLDRSCVGQQQQYGTTVEAFHTASETIRVEALQSRPGLLADISAGIASESGTRSLLVFFTGNPGLAAFYCDFVRHLATSNSLLDVVVVGFAGHGLHELNCSSKQFPLGDQLLIAEQVVQRFIVNAQHPYHAYYTGGHSIGGYVALSVLLLFPSAFTRAFLLTPTICDMARSPNGKMNGPLVRSNILSRVAAATIGLIGSLCPDTIKHCCISLSHPGLSGTGTKVISHLGRANAIKNVLYLARTEFEIVDALDEAGLKSVADKVVMIFSKHDKWVPKETMDKICTTLGVSPSDRVQPTGSFPQCVLVPNEDFPHAWCLYDSKETAEEYVLPYIL